MNIIDRNDRAIRVIERRRGFDVLTVEGARKPQCATVW
jgi:hypothetical protein